MQVSQCSLCSICKFSTKSCPNYFDDIYVSLEINGLHVCSSDQKSDVPHQKANVRQKPYLMLVPHFGAI